jgi:hypothetical protein
MNTSLDTVPFPAADAILNGVEAKGDSIGGAFFAVKLEPTNPPPQLYPPCEWILEPEPPAKKQKRHLVDFFIDESRFVLNVTLESGRFPFLAV